MQKRLSKQEVEFIKKRLQKKQAAFCGYLVSTGDPVTAARRAGFEKNPEQAAEELLCCATVLEEVQRLTEQREKTFAKLASAGYRRLAFGSIADAVSLLFTEQPTLRQLQEMDLFLVSEIKKPKDGMLEIKFFDRLKALEKLAQGDCEQGGVADLFDAIGHSAKAVSGVEHD
ncbi:MAG: terminase small subunit [Ruminococcus sp.]|nr:terminase small subunit [Ruminococcus sp.]